MVDEVRSLAVDVDVSWDGSGSFTGTYDRLNGRLLSNTLAIQYGRDEARPLGEPMVTTAEWVAWNPDSILSPEVASSPLYQLIAPGRPTQITYPMVLPSVVYEDPATDYEDAVFYSGHETMALHSGILETPRHDPQLGMPTVSFQSSGALSRLTRIKISTVLYSGIRIDEIILLILDMVGWPADKREVSLADTTLSWWWAEDETPLDILVRLQHTEGPPALIWEGPDGVFHFENRNYRTTQARSVTPVVTIADSRTAISGVAFETAPDIYHSGVSYAQPFDDVFNRATVTVTRRMEQVYQKVWEYGEPLVLAAGETRTIIAKLSDPFDEIATLALGTDYAVSAGALASIPTYQNNTAQTVRAQFIAGGSGATIIGVTSDGFQIRTKPVIVTSTSVVPSTVDTASSIARYDPTGGQSIPLDINAYPNVTEATAEAIADAAVNYYHEVRPVVRIRLVSFDAMQLYWQAMLRPSDRIIAYSTPLGLGGALWVEAIEHRLVPEGFETVLVCERAVTAQPGAAVWDDGATLWDSGTTLWGV